MYGKTRYRPIIACLLASIITGCASPSTQPPIRFDASAIAAPARTAAIRWKGPYLPMPRAAFGEDRVSVPVWHPHLSYAHPDGAQPCIYVSDYWSGDIFIYSKNLIQVGDLTSPSHYGWGIGTDASSIYAGTFLDTIDVYKPCSGTKPIKTLKGVGDGYPFGIAVSNGTVYADEWPSNIIDIWRNGRHSHQKDANFKEIYFIALDKEGDLFAVGFVGGGVVEIDKCDSNAKNCTPTNINTVNFPGGIAFDQNDNFYVNDQNGSFNMYSGCSTGTCSLKQSFIWAYHYVGALTPIALNASDKQIWSAGVISSSSCPGSVPNCGNATVWSLPLQSSQLLGQTQLISPGKPEGIGYWPPSQI